MWMFINEDDIDRYDSWRKTHWEIKARKDEDWAENGTYTKLIEFSISKNVQNNRSIYWHVVVTKHGYSIDSDEIWKNRAQSFIWMSIGIV